LDGFNLQPRLSVPFDGPIDVNTVNSHTVFLVSLGDTLDPRDRGGQVVGVNQVVWDTFSNTLHVESDELLDQHTRYALVVTDGVRVPRGGPGEARRACGVALLALARKRGRWRRASALAPAEGLVGAWRAGAPPEPVAGASVFSSLSATAVLEKIR